MKVWITRDEDDPFERACIDLRCTKPPNAMSLNGKYYYGGGHFLPMSEDNFKRMFGFTPRKGSCKQYNIEITEVK